MHTPFYHIEIWIGGLFLPILLLADINADAVQVIQSEFSPTSALQLKTELLNESARKIAETASGQRFMLNKLYLWTITDSNQIVGFAVLDNVKGKAQPITYLVVFSPEIQVRLVRVIRYREQYGGAIQNNTWLDQFQGINDGSKLQLGDTIDAISGATISATAITRGVERLSVYLSQLYPPPQSKVSHK